MLNDRFAIHYRGHLTGFVLDPERELLVFVCRLCGAHTEPLHAGESLPSSFAGLNHSATCAVWPYYEALYGSRRAA
jgi:hypothetical protein